MNPRLELHFVVLVVGVLTLAVTVMAPKGERRRGAAFLAAWLVPGAGHALLGKWRKGLFFFAILGLTALFGLWITGFRAVSWDDNPFYYVGQYGSGLTMLLARTISPEKAFPRPDLPISWFDPGLLYVCVAGLLNGVVAMNVLDLRLKGSPEEVLPAPAAGPADVPPAPPVGPAPLEEKA
jgi:hypothetical protein